LSGLICKLVLVDDLNYDIALTLCRRIAEVEVGRPSGFGVGAWYHKMAIDPRLKRASH
jgi:hypothetical protein